MDYLFNPWRYPYVAKIDRQEGCVLCAIAEADSGEDASTHVVHRGEHHFVVVNVYPYNTGHLMVVPYVHVATLGDLDTAARAELIELAARSEALLQDTYHCQGMNIGVNIGRCAGAGIHEHLHLHLVPRWSGDINFMTVTGETRVLPESLDETWSKLHGRF
jgi:ATP adenylyltransferase